ncbi:MAG TPA: DUF4282 domain-containing protein [Beutenbergiaceae bacterium]|nr:DUF4282 domain-containing protein [Beutenbergiaceae bacterium]
MSQYQPPQGQPQPGQSPQGQPQPGQPPQGQPQPQPGQFGQASQAPPQFGQASQAPPQQPGAYGPPGFGGPGGAPYGGPPAPSGPGLFDLSFARPAAPMIAKLGLIGLWILGGFKVGGALVTFIWMVADGNPNTWMVMQALGHVLMSAAIALVLIVLGRMFIELVLSQVRTEEKTGK